jgi:CheY-like chemotaxis protein
MPECMPAQTRNYATCRTNFNVSIRRNASKGDVLVVDDDEILLPLVGEMIARMGFKATIASNAIEALALLKAHHFDIVLTDFQMPQMDGFALAERIKKTTPDLPVVMMTGMRGSKIEDMLKSGLIDEIILKPFSIHAMKRVLEYLMAVPV